MAFVAADMAHARNFVQAKTALLFLQGDSNIAPALEEEANSLIVFLIGATPDDYIIGYAANAFQTFQSLVQSLLEDFAAYLQSKWEA